MNFLSKTFSSLVFVLLVFLAACGGGETGETSEGFQMPESPLLRLFERKSGRILFMGLDGNLYTINQAGEDQIPITSDANPDANSPDYRGYLQFAWAPDSEKIAFVGFDRKNVSLYTTNPDGTDWVTALSTQTDVPIFLHWTPNSDYIGVLSNKLASTELSMQLAAVDGKTEARTIGDGQPYFWDWGPEGSSQFIAHVGGGEASRLVMGYSDGDRTIEWPLTPAYFQSPAWSPDGSKILVCVRDEAETEDSANSLVVTDLEGNITQVVAPIEESVAFGWSPNGRHIAYVMSQHSRGSMLGKLVVQNMENPDEKILVDHPFVVAYFWSPDSKKLVYFTLEVAPGDPEAESEGEQSNFIAMGLYSLDIKSGNSRNLLYFVPTQDFETIITYFDQYQHAATIWSPDSENIVISAVTADGDSSRIIVVPASGNLQPREIADGTLAFWSWK